MSYVALATTTLGSSASTVTFSSIPTTVNGVALKDLVLVANGSPADTSFPAILGRVNANSSTVYFAVRMTGDGTTAGTAVSYNAGTFLDLGTAYGAGSSTTGRFSVIAQYFDFAQTDQHKTVLTRTNTSTSGVQAAACRWGATDAITSLSVLTSGGAGFAAGSTFSLYGVA
jgi:hypothetical protein